MPVTNGGQLTTWDAVIDFLFAGNALFTLRSLKSGLRYTYRVRGKREDAHTVDPTFFVSLLRGPNNEEDYAYVGVLRRDLGLRFTQASRMGPEAPSALILLWFLDKAKRQRAVLGRAKDGVEVWHEGRCGRCGRVLTVPESIARGIGPECAMRKAA